MNSRLAIIKQLRDKGASIKMIDDVASHIGSYESPVFIATVEFILKIKDMVRQSSIDKEQSIGVFNSDTIQVDKISVENVNFTAAKSGANEDDEISDDERRKVLESIEAVELQRQNQQGQEVEQAPTANPRQQNDDKSKKNKTNATKSIKSFLDKLTKGALQSSDKQTKQTQENIQRENAMRLARQQQMQRNSQAVRGSALKMNLLKMKLLSALKEKKDRSIYGDAQWKDKQSAREIKSDVKPNDRNNSQSPEFQAEQAVQQTVVKHVKSQTSSNSKASQDMNISASIDQIIKNDKPKGAEANKPPAEKGKFSQQVEEKTGPKANEDAVAKMQAKEAIAKLQNSGVRTSSTDTAKVKTEIDNQLAKQNAAQTNQQKQR